MTTTPDLTDAAYLLAGFDDPRRLEAGFTRLTALAETGPLRIVDIEFVHSIHGVPSTVLARGVDPALGHLDAHDRHLLTQADLDVVADLIPVGSTAAVVVYAGAAILPVLAEWTRAGAQILREGRVDPAGNGVLTAP